MDAIAKPGPERCEYRRGGSLAGVGAELHGTVVDKDHRTVDQCAERHPGVQPSGAGEPVEVLDVLPKIESWAMRVVEANRRC